MDRLIASIDLMCTPFEPLNQLALPGDRVFTLQAFRYYLRPDLFACSTRREEFLPIMNLAYQSPKAFWEALYRQGYRYITYEYNFSEFHTRVGSPPDPSSSPDWLKVDTIASNETTAIFRITATNPPYMPEWICSENGKGSGQ